MPIMSIFNQVMREIIILLLATYAYVISNTEQQIILYSIILTIYACISNICYNIWLTNVMTSVGRDKQVIYFANVLNETKYTEECIEYQMGSAQAKQQHVQKKYDIAVYSNFLLIIIVIFNIIKYFIFG